MKIQFILGILAIVLTGCDPVYECYINNYSNQEIIIKASPPLEKFFSGEHKNVLISYRFEEHDSFALYKIPEKSELMIFNMIGFSPHEKDFPFTFMEIYAADTLTLDTKAKIISSFENTEKRVFTITLK